MIEGMTEAVIGLLRFIVFAIIAGVTAVSGLNFIMWWENRHIRKFVRTLNEEFDKITGDTRKPHETDGFRTILLELMSYTERDTTLHPALKQSRLDLIRAVRERAFIAKEIS